MIREEMLKLTKVSNSSSPWKRGFCDDCSIFYTLDDLLLHLSFFRGNSLAESLSSQYQYSLWYLRSLGDTVVDHGNVPPAPSLTPIAEHSDLNGEQRNNVSSRCSWGGRYLEHANAGSVVIDAAETMVSPGAGDQHIVSSHSICRWPVSNRQLLRYSVKNQTNTLPRAGNCTAKA